MMAPVAALLDRVNHLCHFRLRLDKFFSRRNEPAREAYAAFKKAVTSPIAGMGRRRSEAAALPKTLRVGRDEGFAVLEPGRKDAGDVVEYARETLRRMDLENADWRDKPHMHTGLLDASRLTLASPPMRLALDPEILGAVSEYLGAVPVLGYLGIWYSRNVERALGSSQLYHCDHADTTQMKVFVYCSEVDAASGPLTVIGAASSRRLRKRIGYTWNGPKYRVADETVREVLGDRDQHPLVGPAGTVAFVDTCRCFHFGSRIGPEAKPRLVTVMQFLRPSAFTLPAMPGMLSPYLRLSGPSLPAYQRLALGENLLRGAAGTRPAEARWSPAMAAAMDA